MSEEVKCCVDCRWYAEKTYIAPRFIDGQHMCTRPIAGYPRRDIVTGVTYQTDKFRRCDGERKVYVDGHEGDHCTLAGRFFEPKPEEPVKRVTLWQATKVWLGHIEALFCGPTGTGPR